MMVMIEVMMIEEMMMMMMMIIKTIVMMRSSGALHIFYLYKPRNTSFINRTHPSIHPWNVT